MIKLSETKQSVRANIELSLASTKRIESVKATYRERKLKLKIEDIINAVLVNISDTELSKCIDHLKDRRESAMEILEALDTGALTKSDIAALIARAKEIDNSK